MNTDKNNVITQIKDSTDIECPSVSHVRMEGSMEHPAKDERCLCKQCGAEIIQIAKRKKRIFCSDGCRQKWWNTHMFMVERSPEVTHHFICPTCKKAFTVYGNSKRKFCSHHCYIRSRYY